MGEPLGALWICSETLSADAAELHGMPAPEAGFIRSAGAFCVTTMRPLKRHTDDPTRGYHCVIVSDAPLSSELSRLLSMAPGWMARRMVRAGVEQQVRDFRNFVRGAASLDDWLTREPQGAFLEH